jgi:dTDP-4-dehydrorhamnose reductase
MAPRPANSVLDNFALRTSGLGELRDFREALAEVVSQLRSGGSIS